MVVNILQILSHAKPMSVTAIEASDMEIPVIETTSRANACGVLCSGAASKGEARVPMTVSENQYVGEESI